MIYGTTKSPPCEGKFFLAVIICILRYANNDLVVVSAS